MKDDFTAKWILENSKTILSEYSSGITVRQLYYRLVSRGMTNDLNHYQRVVSTTSKARWENIIDMNSFIDRERTMFGETAYKLTNLEDMIEQGKQQIIAWMNNYSLNRWENQDNYVELLIEKKALQGVFESPCGSYDVGLGPCKGYPSITFLYETSLRFKEVKDKNLIILYFGDYDPSGLDIQRSIKENLSKLDCNVEIKRIALNAEQIVEFNLPGAPAKTKDTRTAKWNGKSVVELDAIEPNTLKKMCEQAINEYFSQDRFSELKRREKQERAEYQKALKDFVMTFKER
jgi:hypothetical protein